MKDTYVGKAIVGNFSTKEPIKNINDYSLIKINNTMTLKNKHSELKLEEMDENASIITQNFSNEITEFNESIYILTINKNIISVVLYVYKETYKLLLDSETMNIYMDKLLVREKVEDGTIPNADEVKFLTDEFINNRSIFVRTNEKKNRNKFQMFGNNWIAEFEKERNGVFCIIKIYKNRNRNNEDMLSQIYGNINFITWDQAITVSSLLSSKFEVIHSNAIFKAWSEYLDFERQLFNDDMQEKGFVKFKSFEVKGEEIVFTFEESIILNESPLFSNGERIEYEAITTGNANLPKNIDEVMLFKQQRFWETTYLGKCLNDSYDGNKLIFKTPNKLDHLSIGEGIIYMSDKSLNVEHGRRKAIVKVIESKENKSANVLKRLSSPEVVDTQLGSTFNPITNEVLLKMFGKPNIQLKENYREAMSIALNTPDITLIQGPPGTGKTTLIKGLIARLNSMGKNYKILVSSEQHEALYNVVDKLSQNRLIPPFVSSKKFDDSSSEEDEKRLFNNIETFQNSFINLCKDIIRESKEKSNYSKGITKIIYCIQNIKDNNYTKFIIKQELNNIKETLISMGYLETVEDEINKIDQILCIDQISNQEIGMDFETKQIIKRLQSQRIQKDVFLEDDGSFQFKELHRLLSKYGYEENLLQGELYDVLISDDRDKIETVFEQYVNYVDNLRDHFIPRIKDNFELNTYNLKDLIDTLYEKVRIKSQTRSKEFYDIVEDLLFKLNDIDNSNEIIRNYTTVVGSTCAQAQKSKDFTNLQDGKFHYVIIDEAARANPLDIMIPMLSGTKVILIGDHKQLPHYIETDYVKRFENEKGKYTNYDINLLTKSLFAVIYENVENAYNDGRLKFKRHIRINEQHRMHPTIGNFISSAFYDGDIENGEKTVNNINDYHMFDNKSVVWVDVPIYEGLEEGTVSKYRIAEVKKIITIIRDLVRKNPNRNLDIGIMAFYNGQVEYIKEELKKEFPSDVLNNISCNTVDSYQGKEFDITILSGVRSNMYQTADKSLGFIHYSTSRINVALSRGRRLLIVVGDADTFGRNKYFRDYISYVKKEGYYE